MRTTMRVEQPKELTLVGGVVIGQFVVEQLNVLRLNVKYYKNISPGLRAELRKLIKSAISFIADEEPFIYEEHSYLSYYLGAISKVCKIRAKVYELYKETKSKQEDASYKHLTTKEKSNVQYDLCMCSVIAYNLSQIFFCFCFL